MQLIEKLKEVCRSHPQKILFAEAADYRIIKAAKYLKENALAEPVLLGGTFEIHEIAEQNDISTRGLQIVNHKHQNAYMPYVEQLNKKLKYKNYSKDELEILLKDNLFFSMQWLEFSKTDFVLAGNMSTMREVTKTALEVLGICEAYRRASSFYLLMSPTQENIFAFADCSLNINPNAETMAETAIKTAQKFSHITGQSPRLAFLSFSTRGSAQPQNLEKIKMAIQIVSNKAPSLQCDGEIQFDAAIDNAVAEKKGANNVLNGNANVFIFSTLNSANIAQKIAEQLASYLSIGPMIQGLRKNVHHLPKSCTVESVINSALLASFLKIEN